MHLTDKVSWPQPPSHSHPNVGQDGFVLDVLVQSRENAKSTKRLMRKLLKIKGHAPGYDHRQVPFLRGRRQPPAGEALTSIVTRRSHRLSVTENQSMRWVLVVFSS